LKNRKHIIDIGASSIKTNGKISHLPTPKRARPTDLVPILKELIGTNSSRQVLIGFPGVVKGGVVQNAPNLDSKSWSRFPLQKKLSVRGKAITVMNDADLHGILLSPQMGLCLTVALGTGVGSALIKDGVLVPNLELGHQPFKNGKTYEELLGSAAHKKFKHAVWKRNLTEALKNWIRLFQPDLIFLSGGLSTKLALPKKILGVPLKIRGNPL
jgi:polyphosphate glucokinase